MEKDVIFVIVERVVIQNTLQIEESVTVVRSLSGYLKRFHKQLMSCHIIVLSSGSIGKNTGGMAFLIYFLACDVV